MVRLKGPGRCSILLFFLFQFHYGSIKRLLPYYFHITYCHFNSIMVRLKETGVASITIYLNNFNSIMVRLKAGIQNNIIITVFNFNSIMVRLKDTQIFYFCLVYRYFNSIMVRLKVMATSSSE